MTLDFAALVAEATADPAVVGLVLKGSRAHVGMTTRHPDQPRRVPLAADWGRYAIARSRVLVDRRDGEGTESSLP